MSKKIIILLTGIYLFLTGCVTNSVPMEQYIATQQQVNDLNRKISQLEGEQTALKTTIGELKQSPRLPTGVRAVPISRRDGVNAPIDATNSLFQDALAHYKAGDIQSAIGLFGQLINSGNASPSEITMAQYWLGDAYYNQRNFDFASRYLGAYLKADSRGDHAQSAVSKLVQSLKALGRDADAEVLATQGIQALQ